MLKYVKTTCSNTWKMSYFDLGLLIGGYIYILIFSCFDICTLIFSCFDICILISSHHDSPTPTWYHHVAHSRLWINVTRLKYLPRPFSNICLHSDRSRNVLFTMQTNTNVFFHNTNKQNVFFTMQTNKNVFFTANNTNVFFIKQAGQQYNCHCQQNVIEAPLSIQNSWQTVLSKLTEVKWKSLTPNRERPRIISVQGKAFPRDKR